MLRLNRNSLISILLSVLAIILVGCGGPSATTTPPPTYTELQITRIQDYRSDIEKNAERFADLEVSIAKGDWQESRNIMRGPLGEMLMDMRALNRNLLAKDQATPMALTRALTNDFLKIDQGAELDSITVAQEGFREAEADFRAYLNSLPKLS
ncbi:MAG: photosystem II protein PsbQ [Thermosynechococcus sp. Uc]|uniref:photosystem II protein PsbQ n=1 Tax=Thermosynechococcus sp. Uc TaxID=3034853 RepID=UPI00259E20B1|nr:photosystem II protein PsbQ [Thermosynechococcus sp. Uc]MDM7327353.1 photosystem II protein PsbQ [Thermosynechococcus sp. Uc]